jgi:antitoxin component of MazEF toxin-antitoxin module
MEEQQFIRKVRRTGTSLGVNIPKEIIDLAEIKNGDTLKVTIKKIEKGVKD